MDWSDLKYLLAVARSGSLTDASRNLRTSASTVSRRIAELEESLGQQLFSRRPDGYVLNERGQQLIKHAEQVEAAIAAMERDASAPESEPAGMVSLALPELLGNEFIVPQLAGLYRRHPKIVLDVDSNVMPVRLSQRVADIALRVVPPSHGDYRVRKVGSLAIALYASPAYVEEFGELESLSKLGNHRLAGWTSEFHFLQHVSWLESRIDGDQIAMRTSNMTAQFRAAASGLAIALLPKVVAEEAGLVQMARQEEGITLELWLAINNETQAIRRVRIVADYLIDVLSENAARMNPDQ